MTNIFRALFNKAIHTEQQILRPYFFADQHAVPEKLETEETYLRLRLTRMFLQNQRDWFRTKYPVVHTSLRFAGIDGIVETHFIARPEMSGDENTRNLDQIVVLDQTLLGPILYRGGDLDLLLGLYAAPADDWAQRFIGLAEAISQVTLNAPLSTVISVASSVKKAVEGTLLGDGVSLRLGLDKELKEHEWLAPGHLVMIAAPDNQIDQSKLVVEDGELLTQQGDIYTAHDYIVLAIEVSESRSDWQSLGYGHLWQSLLKIAAEAADVQQVKDAYVTFSGTIMGSSDLSWRDRSAIITLTQRRVKAIRDARAGSGFLEGLKGVDDVKGLADDELSDVEILTDEALLSADFLTQ